MCWSNQYNLKYTLPRAGLAPPSSTRRSRDTIGSHNATTVLALFHHASSITRALISNPWSFRFFFFCLVLSECDQCGVMASNELHNISAFMKAALYPITLVRSFISKSRQCAEHGPHVMFGNSSVMMGQLPLQFSALSVITWIMLLLIRKLFMVTSDVKKTNCT